MPHHHIAWSIREWLTTSLSKCNPAVVSDPAPPVIALESFAPSGLASTLAVKHRFLLIKPRPRHRFNRKKTSRVQEMYTIDRGWIFDWHTERYRRTINAHLPMELLREIFLYCIESNQMKSGQLVSVCRYWRSVITTMLHLWSTLRLGAWTETKQVVTWLQRAYPKKVIIDSKRASQRSFERPFGRPTLAALRKAFTSTGQWNELTISSSPPENLASQLGVQVASPMNVLKVLHVAAECIDSPSFAPSCSNRSSAL